MSQPSPSARPPVTPWHRQGWPWFLIFFPATAVVAGIATIWIAIESNDGLVVDDYYKQGLGIQKTLDRAREASRLALSGDLRINDSTLTLNLRSGIGAPVADAVFVTLTHPTQGGMDQTLSLIGQAGSYTAQINPLQMGRWNVLIEDESRSWRLTGTMHLPAETEVSLVPPPEKPVTR
ncbi:MAG: FixH family protein [Rhodocyclaceae bacterium]|nr:FixH family protein [Rhodocyclaceae bacterium]